MASKVYFTDMRADINDSLVKKMIRVVEAAGIDTMDLDKKFVAVKTHFGEKGNMAYLRPNFAKALVDKVKEMGGVPYLTDTNTLYPGGRKNAPDHLQTAAENGYSPVSTGCHIIIADGIKGTDDVEVPFDGDYTKAPRIARGIYDADALITLSHFKGHELTGFGGAIKNLSMGCASRRGKMEMHSMGKSTVDSKLCVGCGRCVSVCGSDAINIENKQATISQELCVGCGRCITACPFDATYAERDRPNQALNCIMAEYAAAALENKVHFHVAIIVDVSPFCDCHAENDVPIIPDLGILASFDPLALDVACAELCNKQEPIPGSRLYENRTKGIEGDVFICSQPASEWKSMVAHAEKKGLGISQYELIIVK